MKLLRASVALVSCVAAVGRPALAAEVKVYDGPAAFLGHFRSRSATKQTEQQQQQRKQRAMKAAYSDDPKYDYNVETTLPFFPVSVEFLFAALFVALMASVPALLAVLVGGGQLTKAHMIESTALLLWLSLALFMFTNVLEFNSAHWDGSRPLTLVEAVYLLAQILTTVGYGDITPAFPRGQVLVAFNVILALCLYGSLIMEVADLVNERVHKALSSMIKVEDPEEYSQRTAREALMPLRDFEAETTPVDMVPFMKSLTAFLVMASIGVLFYHFFPGEDKTWLQAVYMSIITLSTVGFGWFNATTEGGKVFGAFWMLFGVAALGAVLTTFIELMIHVKARQRRNPNEEKLRFFRYVKKCVRMDPKGHCKGMEMYDFMKFGLLLQEVATEDEIAHIEERFQALLPDAEGCIDCDKVRRAEGPPPKNMRGSPR